MSQSPRIGAVIRIDMFNRDDMVFVERSQSPRIGAVIRMEAVARFYRLPAGVSIPSNRGSHSN